MEYPVTKLTKTNVSKILTPWSSSPANEYTKKNAVKTVIDILNGNCYLDELELQTGSFSAKSKCTGGRWKVCRATQTIELLGEKDTVIAGWDFSNS